MTTTPPTDLVGCSGGCSLKVANPLTAGWDYLEITGRYRCGACGIVLYRASMQEGAPPRNDIDKLPPDSIGSLKEMPKRQPLHEKPRND